MIVHARAPEEPLPPSLPERQEPLVELLHRATPRVREALALTVRTLGLKGAQLLDGGLYYLEVCPGYIVTMGPSRWAACQAWALLVAGGWITAVHSDVARAHGAQIAYVTGRGWGQHVLLPVRLRDELAAQTRAWMAEGVLQALPEGDPLASGDPSAEGWEPFVLGRLRASGWHSVRCPFHDDQRPSAGVRLDPDGKAGAGRCFACRRMDGSGLTFAVRKSEAGDWYARRSRPDAGAHGHPYAAPRRDGVLRTRSAEDGLDNPAMEAEEEPSMMSDRHISPLGGPGRAWTTLGARLRHTGTGGATTEARLRGDLFEVLERAAKRSLWKGEAEGALDASARFEQATAMIPGLDRRMFLPDSLYHVSDMYETGHIVVERVYRGKVVRVPEVTGWAPWRQRMVLFDLDGLRWGSPEEVERFAAAATRWIRRRPELSGRSAVVQTSPTGVQVVVELARGRTAPRDWWRLPHVRAWYAATAQALLRLAHRHGAAGGVADLSSGAAGRLGRRPGWRLLKDGSPYRARLVALEDRRVVRRPGATPGAPSGSGPPGGRPP